ncbi:unnamed protein product [Rhodiola kirilowii]
MTSLSAIFLSASRAFISSVKIQSPIQTTSSFSIRVAMGGAKRQYWLLKTEPSEWSWSDQAANNGISNWDGVKNKQAQKNLKSMKLGDLCFFYHSGNKARSVVGVVEVVKEWYLEGGDGEGVVDVKEVGEMRRCVDLKEMKRDEGLKGFELFRQPRLSVVKLSEEIWVRVCGLGDGFVGDGRVEVEDEDEDEDEDVESAKDEEPRIRRLPARLPLTTRTNPAAGGSVRIKGDEFIHMTKVLRLVVDDRVELFDGKGGLVEGCIQHVERGGLDVVALEDPRIVLLQNTQWHVFAALGTLKGGRADWLLEKCTELGACSVTPLLTERSPSISENRMDRLERVILAASKQCQRLHEMALNPPLQVTGFLPIVAKSEMRLIAIAGADPVMNTFVTLKARITRGVIIIGPEGDFTEMEVNVLTKAGAIPVGLGPLRLRVETATVALLSTAMLWSDSQHATT